MEMYFSLVDYGAMEAEWRKKTDAIGVQVTQKTEDYVDADVAEVDSSGKYIAIHAKPHSEKYSNAYRMRGVFILKKKILDYIPTDTVYEIGKQLLPDVIRAWRSILRVWMWRLF